MLTALDANLLAEASPKALCAEATQAAEGVLRCLHEKQWTDRFDVKVGEQVVSIPGRLHFSSTPPAQAEAGAPHLVTLCLASRSHDGFQRQWAVRPLLPVVQPWSAPYIVALIGEYVIEILDDISEGLTPSSSAVLAEFVTANPAYWHLTRQRVASYWDAYYRARFERSAYVGFKLVEALAEAVRNRGRTAERAA